MKDPSRIRVFTPEEGPGVAFDGGWAGVVRGAPGASSPWHHHGDSQAIGHVLSGVVRVQCGPGGDHVVEARQGQFMYVPTFAVHREANWGSDDAVIFVVRIGPGHTFDVDGPGQHSHPCQPPPLVGSSEAPVVRKGRGAS